ncbi:MAG: hypothetical protein K2K73_03285, partial [Ureaplasma sp.]|nr:hypothetical protein [Ureaplasma sp.]
MNKKTIVISTLSSLLVTGGIAGTAAVLINAASRNDGISLNEGVKFTKEDISKLLDSFQDQINKN